MKPVLSSSFRVRDREHPDRQTLDTVVGLSLEEILRRFRKNPKDERGHAEIAGSGPLPAPR